MTWLAIFVLSFLALCVVLFIRARCVLGRDVVRQWEDDRL